MLMMWNIYLLSIMNSCSQTYSFKEKVINLKNTMIFLLNCFVKKCLNIEKM